VDERRKGILLALGGMVVLSTDSLFARAADAGRFDIVFWVGVSTAAATTLIGAARHRQGPVALVRRGGRPLVLVAALQALTLTCFVLAVRTTTVSNVVAIIAVGPLVAAALARVLIGEHSAKRVWVAAAGSGEGANGDISVDHADHDLRRTADERTIRKTQIEHEGAGVYYS